MGLSPPSSAGSLVGGDTASGVADTGNPVKVGGVFKNVPPALTDGFRTDFVTDSRGHLEVSLWPNGGTTALQVNNDVDALTIQGAGNVLRVIAEAYGYNGATVDRLRTPTTFRTVTTVAAGDTAVWTPAAGKKFRLLGYVIYLTANAAQAVAGNFEIVLRDATTAIGLGFSAFVPGAALVTAVAGGVSGPVQLGNGVLSALANNVLNVNLGAALTAGEVRVVTMGTEE